MNHRERSLVLKQAQRHKSAGHYDDALDGYFAALDLTADAPLQRWRRVSSATPCAIEHLIRALRELEVARIAIDEYFVAIGQPGNHYRGFSAMGGRAFAQIHRAHELAPDHLARGAPAHRRAHLEMMLDIVAEDDAGLRRCPELLAYPQLLPIHPRIHLAVAQRLLAAGCHREAHDHLEQAIRLAPCYGPAYRLLGEALIGLDRGAAAARCFDHAAAFWNPEWWSIEFLPGMKVRVPGIVVRGHDIFYWEDMFVAVKISGLQRRLRMATVRILRRLYGMYRQYQLNDWRLRLQGKIGAILLTLPGTHRALQKIRPLVSAVSASRRVALRQGRHVGRALVRLLFPARPPREPQPRRTWRQAFALWLAQAEIMWGRGTALRAANLNEMLDLLERTES